MVRPVLHWLMPAVRPIAVLSNATVNVLLRRRLTVTVRAPPLPFPLIPTRLLIIPPLRSAGLPPTLPLVRFLLVVGRELQVQDQQAILSPTPPTQLAVLARVAAVALV